MNTKHYDVPLKQPSNVPWLKYPKWWDILGQPLRPSQQDLDFLRLEVLPKITYIPSKKKLALLLGVTPEIATLPWDEHTEIMAVDSSPNMINSIWPQEKVPRGKAICGDWRQIPLPDNSCDSILGDGCFTLLDYPDGYQQVLREVCRVLKPQGLLSMRFFLSPSEPEDLSLVFEQLRAKSIGNFHIFKLRLAMALQKSVQEGIAVADIWQVWQEEIANPESFLEELGWSSELLSTMDIYQNSSSVYTFPTLAQIRNIFLPHLRETVTYFPTYELGERCPTILFQLQK